MRHHSSLCFCVGLHSRHWRAVPSLALQGGRLSLVFGVTFDTAAAVSLSGAAAVAFEIDVVDVQGRAVSQ